MHGYCWWTLVNIQKKPWNNQEYWFNGRKKIYCTNNIVVVSHKGLFLLVNLGYPRSYDNVSILQHSCVQKLAQTFGAQQWELPNAFWGSQVHGCEDVHYPLDLSKGTFIQCAWKWPWTSWVGGRLLERSYFDFVHVSKFGNKNIHYFDIAPSNHMRVHKIIHLNLIKESIWSIECQHFHEYKLMLCVTFTNTLCKCNHMSIERMKYFNQKFRCVSKVKCAEILQVSNLHQICKAHYTSIKTLTLVLQFFSFHYGHLDCKFFPNWLS